MSNSQDHARYEGRYSLPTYAQTDGHTAEELERRAEEALFHDYRVAGRAIRQLHDQREWLSDHETWGEYVLERFGVSRGHSYVLMNAAEVADDVSSVDDTLRLPQRHAAMLRPVRDASACEPRARIQRLSQSAAFDVVHAELKKKDLRVNQVAPPPREEPNELRQLDKALAELELVRDDELAAAASSMRMQDKNRLTRRLRANVRKLRQLEANIAAGNRADSQVAPTDDKR